MKKTLRTLRNNFMEYSAWVGVYIGGLFWLSNLWNKWYYYQSPFMSHSLGIVILALFVNTMFWQIGDKADKEEKQDHRAIRSFIHVVLLGSMLFYVSYLFKNKDENRMVEIEFDYQTNTYHNISCKISNNDESVVITRRDFKYENPDLKPCPYCYAFLHPHYGDHAPMPESDYDDSGY